MKKIFALAAVVMLCVTADAQYTWSNPQPAGYSNTAITFTDAKNGFLFNYNGELYKTSDTGNTWQLQHRFPLTNIFKLKDSTGIIAGGRGRIYISSDQGATWQISRFDSTMGIDFVDIVHRDTIFLTASETGTWRKLYRSDNRGATWQLMNQTFHLLPFNLDFVTSKIGFGAAGALGIHKTTDGGVTWNLVYSINTSTGINSMQFADTLRGYAHRGLYGMLKTTDGGISWTSSTGANEEVITINIVNNLVAYAGGRDGCAYKTVDGGDTWNWIGADGLRDAQYILAQHFFNETTGFMTGHRGRILKTTDGGASWKTLSPTHINFTAISMVTNNTGYATNWNNVYKTTDAGNSWQKLPLAVGVEYGDYTWFSSCIFFNADTGILAATNGNTPRLYRTVNGGQSFDTIRIISQYGPDAIAGINFINASTGFATINWFSNQNLVFKTTNGGSNWQQISDVADCPTHLQFLNEQTGYGIKYSQVVKSADSGKTWRIVHTDNEGRQIRSLWFINAQKGFMAGNNAMLKMTADSGRTWTNIVFDNFYEDFLSVRFFGDKVGYLTSTEGAYFKSIDGGITWRKVGYIAHHDCPAISFTGDSTVYIAGMYGTIVKAPIPEFAIDSLQVNIASACQAGFSAKVTAELSTVDSTWFEYGIKNFDHSVAAAPGKVTNGTINVAIPSQQILAGSAYRVRVKALFRGKYYYSDEKVFFTDSLRTPTITVNNYTLTSSADFGNYWFRNDTLIPGAIQKTYTANRGGSYKVRVGNIDCPESFSAAVVLNITGIIDPVLNAELHIYPNPIDGQINIYNQKLHNLGISVKNLAGQQVMYLHNTRQQFITMPAGKLSPGTYLVHITDLQTKKMVTRKVVKVQ
jgi:photosystem II stability/assembly factor-like uncharacterized protein